MKVILLTAFLVAAVSAKPQLDLLKKAAGSVTGIFDGCKDKESSFSTKPGEYTSVK